MTTRKQPIPGIAVSSHIVTPIRTPKFSFNCAAVTDDSFATVNPNFIGTVTPPASSFSEGVIAWQTEGSSLMKLYPVAFRDSASHTITGLKMRVYGWSRDDSLTAAGNASPVARLWWPTHLFGATLTRATGGWSNWNNTNKVSFAWGAMTTIVKTSGDGKIFNAPTDNAGSADFGGACVVIDTLGCQWIDVRFFCTSYTGEPHANVIWHSL